MDLLKKSVQILDNSCLKNGAVLASPREGAYPYVYTRDSVIITKALNRVGKVGVSEKFYYFMRKFSKLEDYKEVFQRYNSNGLPAVTRVNQNDNEGLLLHGIYDTYVHNQKETFIENMWPLAWSTSRLILSYMKGGLVKTSSSIHEYNKLETGYEIWCNSACYRGLIDASKIAAILGHKKESVKLRGKAEEIKKNILSKMYNKKIGVFVKNMKFPDSPDVSQLAPFYFDVIEDKKILKRTLVYLKKHLWEEDIGGFRRFRKFEVCDDWHWYSGGSGSWCALTLIAARFYKKLEMNKEYKECISWISKVAKHSGNLLPEHIAKKEEYGEWKSKEIEFNNRIINEVRKTENQIKEIDGKKMVYWATPLAWSHAEYILLKKEK